MIINRRSVHLAQKLTINKKHTISEHIKGAEQGATFILSEDTSRGEKFCSVCGFVSKEKMEERIAPIQDLVSGDVIYGRSDNGIGKSAYIGSERRDASGAPITTEMQIKMHYLRRWDKRIPVGQNELRIKHAYEYMRNWKDKIGINYTVMEGALSTYEKIFKLKEEYRRSNDSEKLKKYALIKGLSNDAAILACIYKECQLQLVKTTIKKIAAITGVKSKWIVRAYRGVLEALEENSTVHSAIEFVPAISSIANIPRKETLIANAMIKKLEKFSSYVEGKAPSGIAASAIYIACRQTGLIINQDIIAKAAGVTAVTIRNRYKEMVVKLREIDSNPIFSLQPRA